MVHPWSRSTGAIALAVLLPLSAIGSTPAGPENPAGGARILDTSKQIDANRIGMYIANHGITGRDLQSPGGPAGTFYPRGTGQTCLYTMGLWIAGLDGTDRIRAALAEYHTEYQPGTMVDGGGWSDPMLPRFRVFKLTPGSGPGDPDYDEWPVDDGAPLGRDGHPLRAGHQTLWCVYNDANPENHTSFFGSTPPLGIEVTQLSYAYDLPDPLLRVILTDYQLRNRGAEPLHSLVIAPWLDVDLGGPADDVAGCDSVLSISFVYNSNDWDEVYGVHPPAIGLTVLHGPPSGPTNISAAIDYMNGEEPQNSTEMYNFVRGLARDGSSVINPETGHATRFWHSGDPVGHQGWIDDRPGDKRIMLSTGPIAFAPGATESIRVALVIGHTDNYILSEDRVRKAVRTIRRLDEKGAFPYRSRWAVAAARQEAFDPTIEGMQAFVIAPEEGRAVVSVVDSADRWVRDVLDPTDLQPGISEVYWDGRDDLGGLVPPGTYRFRLAVLAPAPSSEQAIVDLEEVRVEYRGGAPSTGPTGSGAPVGTTVLYGGGSIRLAGIQGEAASEARSRAVSGTDQDPEIRLYSIDGRCIRTMRVPESGAFWDGRDDSGRPLPSGIYFARDPNGITRGRLLLLR